MNETNLNEVMDTLTGYGRKIAELKHENEIPQVYTLEGAPYVTQNVRPFEKPTARFLGVSTLTGLVDYLIANVDGLEPRELICHVVSPTRVDVVSKLFGPHQQRQCFIRAEADHVPQITLDRFMDVEAFNIMLMSCFVDDGDRSKVLAISGNVVADTEVQALDDGVSQEASVKTGIRKKDNVDVPNPVFLKPYRTFTDIPQPGGKFVFRLKQTEQGIKCALFDCTGGAWMGEAMDSIKQYLQAELATDAPVQPAGNADSEYSPSAADIRVIA